MKKGNALLGGSALALLLAAQALAQSPQTGATSEIESDQSGTDAEATTNNEIVVTGSRIQGTYNSPTPVTSLSQSDLQAAAPSTLADGLRQLPALTPTGGPTQGGGTANGGQNFLNLRALGNTRTLTLVDGRRFVPANPTNLIDVNLIPQGLVERVDVVTGGASAAYGSDAVGGVVNFILNKRFVGVKADLQMGISQRGDNAEKKAALTYGGSFLDGRLHIVAAGEYFKSDGVQGNAREFRRTARNQLANPAGLPKLVQGTDLRTPFTTGGLVVIGQGGTTAANRRISGLMFDQGGRPVLYDYGTISSDIGVTSGSQNGGDGFRVSTGQEIVRPLERKALFGNLEFEVSDNFLIYAQGVYGKTVAEFQSSPTTGTLTIQRTNPYLAAAAPALVAEMTNLGVTRFLLNRLTLERGLTTQNNENETVRGLFGASGKVGGDWSWDVSFQYGRNNNVNPMFNNLITANMARAVNAVSSGGGIVCADTLSSVAAVRAAAAGCQPFNPFGQGAPSQAALDYVFGTSSFTTKVIQKAADANLSGRLFDLPAGPLAVAVGAEWREISARTVADPLSNAGAYRLVNQQDFYGKYNIKEVYAELQIPILKDSFLGPSLDANIAGRHTSYSTSGGVNTWKAGLNWQLFDSLRLRGTRSRDIRAPNLSELFATGRQNNITIDDTLKTGRTYLSVPNYTFGNAALKPEIADTLVLGLVYRPSFIPDLSFAVDYYDIKIRNAIGNVGGADANVECNRSGGTSPSCAFITRDPVTQAVTQTRTSPLNLTQQETRGIDFEASYRVPLPDSAGRLTLRGIAGYVDENITYSPLVAVPINNAGNDTASLPHWRGTMTVNYSIGAVSAFTQLRYIGPMTWDKTRVLGVDTDFNHINAHVYVDGQLSVRIPAFGNDQEFYVNVQNLLDKSPPYAPIVGGATPLPTDPNLYDQVGRMFRVGVRARF